MTADKSRSARNRLILSMVIYGTIGLFIRWIPLPSSIIANARGIVGVLFLIALLAVRKERIHWDAIRRNLKYLLPCGVMLGFNWILLFEAYRYTTVAVATVCYYLAPMFILVCSPFLFRERLTVPRLICAAVAIAGMVLTSGVLQSGFSGSFTGVFFGLGAALAYAAIVMLSKKQTDISAYDTTITELGIASVVLIPYNLLTVDFSALTVIPAALGLLLVLGVVHTGFAYSLYFGAIPHMKAQTAAILSYIDPVIAILLSALLLREPMDAYTAIGAVLVLGSTFVSELAEGRKAEEH